MPPTAPELEIRSLQIGDDTTAFRTLNEEWITRHFVLEAPDRVVLSDPEGHILEPGGHILMAYANAVPVATLALIPGPNSSYELSKMAVSPTLRGLGIGRRLLQHAIAYARQAGAKSLHLGSSTKLPNAVHLYEAVGFRHVPPAEAGGAAHYDRADVFMKLTL